MVRATGLGLEDMIHVGIDATCWTNDRGYGRFTRSLVTALAARDSGFLQIHCATAQEVLDAIAAGQFRLYAIDDVDQAIEILTGVSAGAADADEMNVPHAITHGRPPGTRRPRARRRRCG